MGVHVLVQSPSNRGDGRRVKENGKSRMQKCKSACAVRIMDNWCSSLRYFEIILKNEHSGRYFTGKRSVESIDFYVFYYSTSRLVGYRILSIEYALV